MKAHPIHWVIRLAILLAAMYVLSIQSDCYEVSPSILKPICEVQHV